MKINFSNSNLATQREKMQSKNNVSFSKLDGAERQLLSFMPKLELNDVLVLSPSLERIASGTMEGTVGRFPRGVFERLIKGNFVLVNKPNHDIVDVSDLSLAGADKAFFRTASGDVKVFRFNRTPIDSEIAKA